MSLASSLVKPYFYIDWNDEERIRVEARKSDVERFLREWGRVRERIDSIREREGDPDRADVETVRETFRFLLGDSLGDEVYGRCLAEVRDGEDDLTEADCVYQLVPAMNVIADAWIEHAADMQHERSQRVERYLERTREARDGAGAL